jgi:hypothetical protein
MSCVSCVVCLLVGCGLDRRPIVIGSGVVTAGSSRSGEAEPAESTPTPTADESSEITPTPTSEESDDSTASPAAGDSDDPPACGPVSGAEQSSDEARVVPTPFRDDEAELDADGQAGDGHTVTVGEVQLSSTDGFVAVCLLDNRRLGLLPVTRSNDDRRVRVPLDEPITGTTRLLVVLYADNGDGEFDWTTDPRVSGDEDDITDLEVERLTYRYTG